MPVHESAVLIVEVSELIAYHFDYAGPLGGGGGGRICPSGARDIETQTSNAQKCPHRRNGKVNFVGYTITCSNQARILGVIFDSCLTFQPHIDQLVPKCSGMLLALNHAKHVIPTGVLKNLITALVSSIIRYCMSVYGICNQTQLHRVQKLVNFAARVLSGRRRHQHISDIITSEYTFSDGGFAPKARSRSPTSDGKRAWVMYVCMYVYLYVFHIYLTIYSAY